MSKRYNANSNARPRGWRKPRSITLLGILVIIIVAVAALEATNTTHFFHRAPTPPVIPTYNSSQKNVSSSNQGGSSNPNSSKTPGSTSNTQQSNATSKTTPNTEGLPLYAPYGNFVSNHHPGQNGSPTSETSVCNTTPGAYCYISFTNGGTTTELTAQKTDDSGATYWYWDVKKANLGPGNWKVTAVATLNGQTKSTPDETYLTIQ